MFEDGQRYAWWLRHQVADHHFDGLRSNLGKPEARDNIGNDRSPEFDPFGRGRIVSLEIKIDTGTAVVLFQVGRRFFDKVIPGLAPFVTVSRGDIFDLEMAILPEAPGKTGYAPQCRKDKGEEEKGRDDFIA